MAKIMRNEDEFILGCCKFLRPDHGRLEELHGGGLDYAYILGQLLMHRVGGAAWHTLRGSPLLGRLNREFKNALSAIYETNVEKSESFKKALGYLAGMLASARFPYALLKGSYLSGLYPAGVRTSNDIDMLVGYGSLTEIGEMLLGHGFVQGHIRNGGIAPAGRAQIVAAQMNRGETVPWVREVDYPRMKFLEIDLNLSLDFKPDGDGAAVGRFLENAVAGIETENGTLRTLARDDFVMQLCAHIYKEATTYSWVEFGRDQGLYKYMDIYLMAHEFGDGIVNREKINELGLQKECCYALRGTNELFGLDLPLGGIGVGEMGFVNEVVDAAGKKRYRHDMEFIEWVFCPRRKEMLREAAAQ